MLRQPKLVKVDTDKRSFNDITFTKGDTCELVFEITAKGVPITEYTEAHIVLTKDGNVIGMLPMQLNPLSYSFGSEIKVEGKYDCVVIVHNLTEQATSKPFEVIFTPEIVASLIDKEENINVITDLYARMAINDEFILQLFDVTDGLQTQINTVNNDLQAQQEDINSRISKTTTEKQIIMSEVEINQKLIVNGDIYQRGTEKKIITEVVESKNDFIKLRHGNPIGLAPGQYTGIEAEKYDGTNNGHLVFDRDGIARVGDVGDEQPLATREETPINGGIPVWDQANNRFATKSKEEIITLPTAKYTDLPLQAITPSYRNALAQLKSLYGKNEINISQSDLDKSTWSVSDTLKNRRYLDEQGQWRVEENVGKVIYTSSFTAHSMTSNTMYMYNNVVNNIKPSGEISSNLFIRKPIGGVSDEEGIFIYGNRIYIRVNKSRVGMDANDMSLNNANNLVNAYFAQNPLTVTYELAVKNPKSKVIENNDIYDINTSYSNIDYVRVRKPIDYKGYMVWDTNVTYSLDTYTTLVNSGNYNDSTLVGKIISNATQDSFWLGITKGKYADKSSLVNDVNNGIIGKTLTYELATPRYAQTTGISSVVNPKIVSVGKNLFDGENGWVAGKGLTATGEEVIGVTLAYNQNYIKVKPNTSYYLSCKNTIDTHRILLYDAKKQFIKRIDGLGYKEFQTSDNCYYIRYTNFNASGSIIPIEVMLNEGTTPLPYEPYQSHTLQITGEYNEGDKVEGYVETINKVKVKLWELTPTVFRTTQSAVYEFVYDNFNTNYKLKTTPTKYGFINTFNWEYTNDNVRHWKTVYGDTSVHLFVEKELIDQQTGATLVDKLKAYLQSIGATFIGDRATPIVRAINSKGLLETFDGGTIYLQSDGIIGDAVLSLADNDKAENTIVKNEIHRLYAKMT